jgi:SAM-dependent methyltransferase
MQQHTRDPTAGRYVLATGEAAAYRLALLHDLYQEGTRRVLLDAGLRRGMRVADLGCGVGLVTALLAVLVGPEGHAVGIDASAAQLAQARTRWCHGTNTRFVEASATATGLPRESFDLGVLSLPPDPPAPPRAGLARNAGAAQAGRHPGV